MRPPCLGSTVARRDCDAGYSRTTSFERTGINLTSILNVICAMAKEKKNLYFAFFCDNNYIEIMSSYNHIFVIILRKNYQALQSIHIKAIYMLIKLLKNTLVFFPVYFTLVNIS